MRLQSQMLYTFLLSFIVGTAQADHPTVAFGSEASGPINTIAANTLAKGQTSLGLRTEIIGFDEFSDAELERLAAAGREGIHSAEHLINTSFAAAHGITDDFTISARIPYVERTNIRESEVENGVPEAHPHGSSSGIGDAVVLGQYRFWQNPEIADAAFMLGIKAPTGKRDNKDAGVRLETEFQPGTGSWDYLFGVAVSKQSGANGMHASFLFNKTTEGTQDTTIGDAYLYNAAFTHRLFSEHKHDDTHSVSAHGHIEWDVMLELNGETRSKNDIAGLDDEHSGGTVIFLSPGIRASYGNQFSTFVSAGIPVIQSLNGRQAQYDYRLVAGISVAL